MAAVAQVKVASPAPATTPAPAVTPVPAPAPPATSQRIEVDGQVQSPDEERRQSLQLMTVVGREELDAYGDTSVLDVLQRLPGVSVDGDQPRLRGMGAGYTQILINGEPAPPGFSLEQLAPADIERIEIIKGPSAEYGGVAGTINVILRTPPKLRQRELRGTLTHRPHRVAGSASASWGDRIDTIGFQLPLSAYQWAGQNISQIDRLTRSADGQLREYQVAGQDQWHGGGVNFGPRLEWRPSELQTLTWQSFLQRNETGNGNQRQLELLQGAPPLSITDERTTASGSWQLLRSQLHWTQRWADGLRVEWRGSWQDSRGRNRSRYEGVAGPSAPLLRETHSTSDEIRAATGLKLRWPLADGHVLAAGVEWDARERDELRRVFENGVELITTSQGVPFGVHQRRQVIHLQDEWSVSPRLFAMLGVRAERLQTRSTSLAGDVDARHAFITPVLQWRWALDAKARDLFRGSLSRATRLPDLSSLMGRYVLNTTYDRVTPNTPLAADSAGNPLLRPERAWAAEVALETYLAGGGVVSLSAFHRSIDDLIRRRLALETVAEAAVPRWVSRPSNFGRATSYGLEVELKGRAAQLLPVWFEPRSALQLRASITLYRSRVEQVDDPDARLEGQPPWRASLGLDRPPQVQVLGFGANVSYTPGFSTQQTDLQRVRRNATRRIDGYVAWRFDRQTQLRLAVQNLAAVDAVTVNTVLDLDGFTALNRQVRPYQTVVNLNLVSRF